MVDNNKPTWLIEYEERLDDRQIVHIEYDREGDVLEVFFAEGAGCGVELTDDIVLRYDEASGRPLSLIFLTFSHLVHPTE